MKARRLLFFPALPRWFFPKAKARLERLCKENEKLKADLRGYSTIINMAPYPIWQRDAGLAIRFYNLSYSMAVEDVGAAAEISDTPELDKKARGMAQQAFATGKPATDRRHIIVGGERRLYDIMELPVPEEKISVGFAIDRSEVEALKEDLARHVSAQDDLLESSASAMAIYGADMRLKTFNAAFVALWKFDEVWLDTQPTYGEILENLREKRKLPEQANFQMFKQQQVKLFTGLIDPHEEFFYLPDGKALRVIAIPHALGGILFAYEDVTDRLALERSYNTLIAVQRETLDNLHEGVAVFGEDGRLKLFNPGYLALWRLDAESARAEPHIRDIVEQCRPLYMYDDWESFK
ncbi:MAG: PAS-domain containing protein, partial [Pseudomonadota bacterium]|nr:PAS-domain containing protein [Pseudomonadota bacterium]